MEQELAELRRRLVEVDRTRAALVQSIRHLEKAQLQASILNKTAGQKRVQFVEDNLLLDNRTMAHALREAGLYSRTTSTIDIALRVGRIRQKLTNSICGPH